MLYVIFPIVFTFLLEIPFDFVAVLGFVHFRLFLLFMLCDW